MKHDEFLQKANYIKKLAEKERTGTPKELSERINVSEQSLCLIINTLKKSGVPIAYVRKKKNYCIVAPKYIKL